MQSIVSDDTVKNRWLISPGAVGSVGDVVGAVRLKQSAADLPMRWDKTFPVGKGLNRVGSNVTDGSHENIESGGGPARVLDSNWQSGRKMKRNVGWMFQDYRAPDNLVEPYVSSTFDFDWRNKIATVYEAKRPGQMFLPLPGGYAPSPGELTRGASVRITDIEPGDLVPEKSVLVPSTPSPTAVGQRFL